jgi:tRNA A37 threonylcarbamoyltransferase TsaD
MIQLAAWLIGWKAKAAVIAGGVMALVALRAWDISRQQAKGAAKAVAKIEKATDNASKAGKRAAERAATPGVRGQRDPTSRDD